MDSDWSVELGPDDPALEFPWNSPDGTQRFADLLQHPEAIAEIPEAVQYPELRGLLLAVNVPPSKWLSAKCDVWLDDELGEAESIYEARLKFCSYVDLIARNATTRFSFELHEGLVKSVARALSSDDEDLISCEFIIRRCWYHAASHVESTVHTSVADPNNEDLAPGFYVTFYLSAYGNDATQARSRWAEGLRRITAVLVASAP